MTVYDYLLWAVDIKYDINFLETTILILILQKWSYEVLLDRHKNGTGLNRLMGSQPLFSIPLSTCFA